MHSKAQVISEGKTPVALPVSPSVSWLVVMIRARFAGQIKFGDLVMRMKAQQVQGSRKAKIDRDGKHRDSYEY